MTKFSLAILLLGSLASVAAPGPTVAQETAAASMSDPGNLTQGYVLGPGDAIRVDLLGQPQFSTTQSIQADGTVTLPDLGAVRAQGQTVLQFREEVARLLKLGGYYVDPVVVVGVAAYASRYVTVLGEFGSTGILPIDRAYRVSEILARAGGARGTAGDILLLRRANDEELRLSISEIASGGSAQDPFVNPNDKLYIAPASNFYIYGQVGAPGAYKIEKGMTYRMALARAGGVTDRGSTKKISIYRAGERVKVELDQPVGPDDTIYIGERFF